MVEGVHKDWKLDIDEIFNNTRKNMIPQDLKKRLEKYPALKALVENDYYIEKLERQYPKEIGILKAALKEAQDIGQVHYEQKMKLIEKIKNL